MSDKAVLLIKFIPQLILILGVIINLIIGLFANKITKKLKFLKQRMRIIYGYFSVIISVISYLTYLYILTPFQGTKIELLPMEIDIFSASIYSVVVLSSIVIIFFSIVEANLNSEKSFMAFISLLLIQSSSFFIVSSITWIFVFFGFVILFSSLSFYIRSLSPITNSPEKTKSISSTTLLNSISLALLFVGISILYFSQRSFEISSELYLDLWSYLGIILIIISMFVNSGTPPFHFWIFDYSKDNGISTSSYLLVVQRGISLAFMSKFCLQLYTLGLSKLLTWLFMILGIIFALWGSIAAMTVNKLKTLLHYASLIHLGIILMLMSNIMASTEKGTFLNESIKSLSFLLILYFLIFIFSFSIIGLLSSRYGNDDFTVLKDLGRRSNSLFLFTSLSYLIIFALPIALPFISHDIFFNNILDIQGLLLSITCVILLVFSLVYMIRLIKWFFVENYRRTTGMNYVETGFHISFIVSLVYVVLLLVFVNSFLEYLSLIVESLTK
jgi:NADH:ubiquinone oxidoreductase subunit 2 (subunit N)